MTWLERLVDAPLSAAIGWAVLHSLWQGVVIGSALALVISCTRSARVRYRAGLLALSILAASFGFTLAYLLPGTHADPHASAVFVVAPWRPLSTSGFHAPWFTAVQTLIPWIAPVWLCGVCLYYLRYTAGWISAQRLRTRAACHAPQEWQQRLGQLANGIKLSQRVVLLESLFADTPIVLGHLRPVILVPLGFLSGLPPDQVEAVLLHELAHIARSDYLANMCARLLEGLLFYHPVTWWISRVIRTEREHCCDDLAVSWIGDAQSYAAALTKLETQRQQNWAVGQATLAAKGGNLMNRIVRLLYPKGPSGVWAPIVATFVLVATAGLVMAAWYPGPQQYAAKSQNAWDKWVNEDVVYIISDAERAAFERLQTDAERQHFIEQFWDRRNPAPGTAENPFKEEHYRRIAFANKHFATQAGTLGWKTDRGHIYIVYGPPDEIESHPGPGSGDPPNEMWRYRPTQTNKGGFFTFVDPAGTKEYRLAPSQP